VVVAGHAVEVPLELEQEETPDPRAVEISENMPLAGGDVPDPEQVDP
jgi:hypothetical protein